MSASEQEGEGPVIKDRRRIDPVTGQPRHPAEPLDDDDAKDGSAGQTHRGSGQPRPGRHAASKPGSVRQDAAGAGSAATETASQVQDESDRTEVLVDADAVDQQSGGPNVAAMLAERTADLQRVQAEYANYRKRVERDRVAVREHALASVVAELLPVLDDIGRAREHEELTGGFKAIAEALESVVSKLGLSTFGEAGESFDPNVHEALMHSYSPDVTEPTCVQILQPGYKVGERILRPARVAVAEPTDPAGARTISDVDDGQDSGLGDTASENHDGEQATGQDDAL
jgi:molecular chaperone GrpE